MRVRCPVGTDSNSDFPGTAQGSSKGGVGRDVARHSSISRLTRPSGRYRRFRKSKRESQEIRDLEIAAIRERASQPSQDEQATPLRVLSRRERRGLRQGRNREVSQNVSRAPVMSCDNRPRMSLKGRICSTGGMERGKMAGKEEMETMTYREVVLRQALALPLADRAFVVAALEKSLSATAELPADAVAPSGPDAVTGDEFLAELQRRSAAYKNGTMSSRSAADVIADLRNYANGWARKWISASWPLPKRRLWGMRLS